MDYTIETCPHCGGNATLCAHKGKEKDTYFIFVKCDICRAQGTIFLAYADPLENDWSDVACVKALQAWNRRCEAGKIIEKG